MHRRMHKPAKLLLPTMGNSIDSLQRNKSAKPGTLTPAATDLSFESASIAKYCIFVL
jgi:hypothetical protein